MEVWLMGRRRLISHSRGEKKGGGGTNGFWFLGPSPLIPLGEGDRVLGHEHSQMGQEEY